MHRVMVVEDCFALDGKGVVLTGNLGAHPMPAAAAPVVVRRPGLKSLNTMILEATAFTEPLARSSPRAFSVLLPADIRVSDVPLGSEVWAESTAS